MIPDELRKRLELFDFKENDTTGNYVSLSEKKLHLTEKKEEGQAEIDIILSSVGILFPHVDDNKVNYLSNKSNADDIIICNLNEETPVVNVVEIKKTVSESRWNKIKKQFAGALSYVAGILGILGKKYSTEKISLYTIYLNEKFVKQSKENPVLVHLANTGGGKKEWQGESVNIESPLGGIIKHKKINSVLENEVMKANIMI